jgi:hypothetical protein
MYEDSLGMILLRAVLRLVGFFLQTKLVTE